MSLNVYTRREEIPKGMKCIDINDSYFNINTLLSNEKNMELIRDILSDIDKAKFATENSFYGRTNDKIAILKEFLSTGSKTLINIIGHPDVCFNVIECGNNALEFLTRIKNGNVLWEIPVMLPKEDLECDIMYRGNRYMKIFDFLDAVRMDENNE